MSLFDQKNKATNKKNANEALGASNHHLFTNDFHLVVMCSAF